jgi:4-hydroxybenzoate polyprenyltransferase
MRAMNKERTPRSHIADLIMTLRVNQWPKNLVVLAAFFFALWDREQNLDMLSGLTRAVPAMLIFCMIASGVYVLNDIRDIHADRAHPLKKSRPIAAGRVPVSTASFLGLILVTGGGILSYLLSPAFASVVCLYVAIQIAYSFGLKQIALLDILVIAAGFVLRAIAGAVVLGNDVTISPWLLLCTFLLALFLALCKRRHERIAVDTADFEQRPSLQKYDERLLDLLIAIASSATVTSYALYTLWPDTVRKFGTTKLGFTIPFVIFGIFRYLDLVYRHQKGDRPEKILLTDIPILIDVILYAITVVAICVLHG